MGVGLTLHLAVSTDHHGVGLNTTDVGRSGIGRRRSSGGGCNRIKIGVGEASHRAGITNGDAVVNNVASAL